MKASHHNGEVSKSLPSLPVARLRGHEGPVHAVRFTADGKYCVTAGNDRTVRLWNPTRLDPAYPTQRSQYIASHQNNPQFSIPVDAIPPALPIQTYSDGHSHPISAIGIDDQSTTLLSTSERTLVVTDILSKSVKRRFHGHTARINTVSCSSSAEALCSGSYDGTVRLWDGRSWNPNPIQVLDDATDSITSVLVVQNDDAAAEIITAGVDGTVRTYDLRKGELRSDETWEPITDMALSRDGKCLVLNRLDGSLLLMERESGEVLNTYAGRHIAGRYGLECDILADDQYVLTGSEDGKLVMYHLVEAKMVQSLSGHKRPTCSVVAHPKRDKCSVVISASYDGNAVVWANPDEAAQWDE